MYEEYFTEEHEIFRSAVRKFVEREIKPHIDRWEDEELFPTELYNGAPMRVSSVSAIPRPTGEPPATGSCPSSSPKR